MEKFLEKVEEYNIFNNLLPGIIFTYLLKYYIGIDIFQNNILEMVFIYYFIGATISRIGSVVLEEILKKTGFIKYSDKKDYIEATKQDKIIEKLLMNNNMYRTICSAFIVLLVLKIVKAIIDYYNFSRNIAFTGIIIIGAILYLFAYRKQTKQIKDRVESVNSKK